jgi:hypothetical protein
MKKKEADAQDKAVDPKTGKAKKGASLIPD